LRLFHIVNCFCSQIDIILNVKTSTDFLHSYAEMVKKSIGLMKPNKKNVFFVKSLRLVIGNFDNNLIKFKI